MGYLLSVVIPTKNRYETLIPLIRVLAKWDDADLEIVIEDNSDDNNEFISFFNTLINPNVKYYYNNTWRSVVDNSDQAILHSGGKYVTFIGDDDAVVRQITEIVRIMDRYQIDSCGCDYVLYRWPSALTDKKGSFEYHPKGSLIRRPNVEKELDYMLQNGLQSKQNIPGVYHGIVKRTVLEQVYKQTGTFFPGPSPDMANSVAVALFSKRHIMTSIPFIVDGYSKASKGHLTEAKEHIGRLEDQPFLPKDTLQDWTKEIPKIWLPNTIWPESAMQAMIRCGRKDLTARFNYTAMYIKIAALYPQCKKICRKYIQQYSGWKRYLVAYFFVTKSYFKNRIKKLREKLSYKRVYIRQTISVDEAIRKTEEQIEKGEWITQMEKKLCKDVCKG